MRRTCHINHRVTQSAFRAFDYAPVIGKPLNTFVVICMRDILPTEVTHKFSCIRHKWTDWLSYLRSRGHEDCPPVYVYSFENPPGDVLHVNWVLHVPPRRRAEFVRKVERWAKKVLVEVGPNDVYVDIVTASHAKVLAKYILKGTDARYTGHFHLRGLNPDQGEIMGRRAGIAQAIGHRARKRAGFHPGRRVYGPPSRRPAGSPAGVPASPP